MVFGAYFQRHQEAWERDRLLDWDWILRAPGVFGLHRLRRQNFSGEPQSRHSRKPQFRVDGERIRFGGIYCTILEGEEATSEDDSEAIASGQ